jgi:hypothetical protein
MSTREVPASVGQRLLWFLDRYRGPSGAMNCPVLCRIRGPLQLCTLTATLNYLTLRHESLRTTFTGRGRNLAQVIHKSASLPITIVDLSGRGPADAHVDDAVGLELRTHLDPELSPVKFTLWRLGEDDHVFCVNMHHLVTDTWSCSVLFRELAEVYAGCSVGSPRLPPVGWQYSHFTRWQERQLQSEQFQRHQEYWRHQLAGVKPPRLALAPRGRASIGQRASAYANIDSAVATALRRLARSTNSTLFTVMLAVWYGVAYRSTGQNDLAVATLFANRTRREVEHTVGFLANLLVLRTRLPANPTFVNVVRATRQTVIDAFAHQAMPFHLLSDSSSRPNAGRLDDVVFQSLAEPLDVTLPAGDVEFVGIAPDVVGRFDVELALMPRADGFAVKLYYTPERLDPSEAARLIAAYQSLASAAAAAPDMPL